MIFLVFLATASAFNPIEELLHLNGEIAELHESEDIDPWSISQAHGMIQEIVTQSTQGDVASVIRTTRDVCENKTPLLCLGNMKSDILSDTIQTVTSIFADEPINVLEMGAHLGDGTVHFLKGLPPGSTIFSVENNPMELQEGHKLLRHAVQGTGINYVPYLLDHEHAPFETFLDTLMREHNVKQFHTVMFDHTPQHFGKHIEHLHKKGLIKENTHIIADNVKMNKNRMPDFIKEIKTDDKYETKIHDIKEPYHDQMSVSKVKKKLPADEL